MSAELEKIESDINFDLIRGRDVRGHIERIYALGYKAGKLDQKKITQRIKYRYNVLLDWFDDQLNQFSSFTKRAEYKDAIDGICDQAEQYRFENNLHSSYKPRVFSYTIEGEEFTVDAKKDLSYLLVDSMGNLIQREEDKQRRERERLAEEAKLKK